MAKSPTQLLNEFREAISDATSAGLASGVQSVLRDKSKHKKKLAEEMFGAADPRAQLDIIRRRYAAERKALNEQKIVMDQIQRSAGTTRRALIESGKKHGFRVSGAAQARSVEAQAKAKFLSGQLGEAKTHQKSALAFLEKELERYEAEKTRQEEEDKGKVKEKFKVAGEVMGKLLVEALEKMGFSNLGTAIRTSFDAQNRKKYGTVGATALGIGRGLLGFLAQSYEVARQTSNAMLGLAGLVGGRQAQSAATFDARYGYTPAEQAKLGSMYARNVGDLGRTLPGTRGGKYREGLEAMMQAERLGGLGQPFAQLMGGLAQAGGIPTVGKNKSAAKKVLSDVIAVAIDQGLKRGRWHEMFKGFAQMAKLAPLGSKVDFEAMTLLTSVFGKKGAGFSGERSIQAMMAMNTLVSGKGGGESRAIAMMAAGLGTGGKGVFDVISAMQGGMFTGKKGEGLDRAAAYIDTLGKLVGGGETGKKMQAYLLSQQTGEKISMKGAARIIEAFKEYSETKDKQALRKRLDKIKDQEKPLRVKAFEAMSQFGEFKRVTLKWQQTQLTIGRMIRGAVLSISSFLQKRVQGVLDTFRLLSKAGGYGAVVKKAGGGLGGRLDTIFALIAGMSGYSGPLRDILNPNKKRKKWTPKKREQVQQRERVRSQVEGKMGASLYRPPTETSVKLAAHPLLNSLIEGVNVYYQYNYDNGGFGIG